jgi:hypothetical protein
MTTQTKIHSISIFDLFILAPQRLDENFYEDEEQLAAELAAPLPGWLADQPLPEIDPDEFERLYTWFLA